MKALLLAATAAALAISGTASAATTFAQYELSNAKPNLTWTESGASSSIAQDPTNKMTGQAVVDFSFVGIKRLKDFKNLTSDFTFSGDVAGTATKSGGQITEVLDNGTFDFLYEGNKSMLDGISVHDGETLLAGTFQSADLTGSGDSWSIDSVSGVTFTSDFLNFKKSKNDSFSLDLTSLSAPKIMKDNYLGSFTATSTGTFGGTPTAVPEPATWAMLLVGFGGIGASMRSARRANKARAVAA